MTPPTVRHLPAILLLVIAIPFVVALLFLMPFEFCVASWHLVRAKSTVEGTVLAASASHSKKHWSDTRSLVTYSYEVDGKQFTGQRVRAGWLSETVHESGGAAFAQGLKSGDRVTVHYDPAAPDFSLLDYGWPKWSLGISMLVWGLWIGSLIFPRKARRPTTFWAYGLTRGLVIMGVLMIFLLPPTVPPAASWELAIAFVVLSLFAFVYARLRYPRHASA